MAAVLRRVDTTLSGFTRLVASMRNVFQTTQHLYNAEFVRNILSVYSDPNNLHIISYDDLLPMVDSESKKILKDLIKIRDFQVKKWQNPLTNPYRRPLSKIGSSLDPFFAGVQGGISFSACVIQSGLTSNHWPDFVQLLILAKSNSNFQGFSQEEFDIVLDHFKPSNKSLLEIYPYLNLNDEYRVCRQLKTSYEAVNFYLEQIICLEGMKGRQKPKDFRRRCGDNLKENYNSFLKLIEGLYGGERDSNFGLTIADFCKVRDHYGQSSKSNFKLYRYLNSDTKDELCRWVELPRHIMDFYCYQILPMEDKKLVPSVLSKSTPVKKTNPEEWNAFLEFMKIVREPLSPQKLDLICNFFGKDPLEALDLLRYMSHDAVRHVSKKIQVFLNVSSFLQDDFPLIPWIQAMHSNDGEVIKKLIQKNKDHKQVNLNTLNKIAEALNRRNQWMWSTEIVKGVIQSGIKGSSDNFVRMFHLSNPDAQNVLLSHFGCSEDNLRDIQNHQIPRYFLPNETTVEFLQMYLEPGSFTLPMIMSLNRPLGTLNHLFPLMDDDARAYIQGTQNIDVLAKITAINRKSEKKIPLLIPFIDACFNDAPIQPFNRGLTVKELIQIFKELKPIVERYRRNLSKPISKPSYRSILRMPHSSIEVDPVPKIPVSVIQQLLAQYRISDAELKELYALSDDAGKRYISGIGSRTNPSDIQRELYFCSVTSFMDKLSDLDRMAIFETRMPSSESLVAGFLMKKPTIEQLDMAMSVWDRNIIGSVSQGFRSCLSGLYSNVLNQRWYDINNFHLDVLQIMMDLVRLKDPSWEVSVDFLKGLQNRNIVPKKDLGKLYMGSSHEAKRYILEQMKISPNLVAVFVERNESRDLATVISSEAITLDKCIEASVFINTYIEAGFLLNKAAVDILISCFGLNREVTTKLGKVISTDLANYYNQLYEQQERDLYIKKRSQEIINLVSLYSDNNTKLHYFEEHQVEYVEECCPYPYESTDHHDHSKCFKTKYKTELERREDSVFLLLSRKDVDDFICNNFSRTEEEIIREFRMLISYKAATNPKYWVEFK